MNASLKVTSRCAGVVLTLLASPAWAGITHTTGLPAALSAVGQFGSGGNDSRTQTDQLLKQARTALAENRLDQAEQLLAKAEKLGSTYDPISAKIYDTPSKLRRDVEAAKVAKRPAAAPRSPALLTAGSKPAVPGVRPAADTAINAMTDDSKAKARSWLDLGRKALAQGNLVEAQAAHQKAVAAGAKFGPGEYSPDMLAADLQKAGGSVAQSPAGGAPSPFTLRPSDIGTETDSRYPESKTPSSTSRYDSAFGGGELNPNNLPAETNPLTASPATRSAPGGDFQPAGHQVVAGPQRLPNVGAERLPPAAADDDNLRRAKAEAMRLTNQARSARERGDWDNAFRFAEQAERMNLPDTAFARDEQRPWQLMLELNKDSARRGAVQPAGGVADRQSEFPVERGVYDPQRDSTRVVPVQGEGLIAQPQPSQGEKLYLEGLDALQNGDRDEATAKFQAAWKFENEFDPATRQDLKDKLSLLRPVPANVPRTAEAAPAEEIDSEQYLRYQKLLREISAERQTAEKLANDDPKQALGNLKELRDRVADADLDPAGRRQLLTLLDRSTKDMETFIDRNRGDIELRERNSEVRNEISRDRQMTAQSQQRLAEIVEQFNKLMDEQRYPEAEVLAKQARELDPNSSIADMLTWKSHFAKNFSGSVSIQDAKQRGFVDQLGAVDAASTGFNDNIPYQHGSAKEWEMMSKSRKQFEEEFGRKLNPAEQEIEKSLGKQVELNFENRPLAEVVDVLSKMAGINMHLDPQGLHAEAVTSDTPVTFKLTNPVSLKSALNLILSQHQLSYVIRNEVLLITSQDTRDSHTYNKVYYVADLVTPIPNFSPSYNIGLPAAIRESFSAMGYGSGGGFRPAFGTVPMTLSQNEANGQMPENSSMMAQMGGAQMQGANGAPMPVPYSSRGMGGPAGGQGPGGLGGGVIADFDTIIALIQETISPDSWIDNGGQGSISGFPTNLSLVVSQTQDIHADIADLLAQLRRLQDLQVTIEVRFITLQDNFFERIGVDFDFRIDDNSGLAVAPNTVIPDDDGRSYAIGLSPNGQPTGDLDFAFAQDTFTSAVPQFGGFDATSAANFGFAILSDIEVFFLLNALQGDTRTNVLQAPKVTLFNGQQATVTDSTQRPFVTSIIPVVGDFAAAQQPVVTVLSEGTSLSVQAVVSSDRRFVRLTLVPMFTKIGDVQTFTFNGKTTSNSGTTVQDPTDPTKKIINGNETSTEGTTVQLPSVSITSVSTTVSVPDGGTVLLGGIKRLSEGRNERGIPLLSKVPYVSRLFKNVGIGRQTSSLMMMVTPRIIIQEEEEIKLGLDPPQ